MALHQPESSTWSSEELAPWEHMWTTRVREFELVRFVVNGREDITIVQYPDGSPYSAGLIIEDENLYQAVVAKMREHGIPVVDFEVSRLKTRTLKYASIHNS